MMNGDCLGFMGSMGGLGWIMPLAMLILIGLACAALIKYLLNAKK